MLAVALLSSRPNIRFLLLNCTEVVPNRQTASGKPGDLSGCLAALCAVAADQLLDPVVNLVTDRSDCLERLLSDQGAEASLRPRT